MPNDRSECLSNCVGEVLVTVKIKLFRKIKYYDMPSGGLHAVRPFSTKNELPTVKV